MTINKVKTSQFEKAKNGIKTTGKMLKNVEFFPTAKSRNSKDIKKPMKTDSSNSTTRINTIDSKAIELLIEIDNFNDMRQQLSQYRKSMNLMLPSNAVIKNITDDLISKADLVSLQKAHEQGISAVSTANRFLYHYHNILTAQLSNPAAWGMHPIIDSLSFTLEASPTELQNIRKFMQSKSAKHKQGLSIKPAIKSKQEKKYKEEQYNRNLYKHTVHISLSEGSSPIYFSYDLKGKTGAVKHRPVRISFNPARFEAKALKKIFQALTHANIFKNFRHTLMDANITRLDIAIDLLGVPTPMVILDLKQVKKHSYYPKRNINIAFVKTVYVGSERSSHFVTYSKHEKIIDLNQKHVHSLIGPDTNPLYVVRVEKVYKPQKNGTVLKLKDLNKTPFMFKSANFYSPLAYKEIDTTEHTTGALRKGFLYEMLDLAKKQYELKLGGEESHLVNDKTLSHSMALRSVRHRMQRHEIPVNKEWFKEYQTKMLKRVLKQIIPDM